MFRTIALCTAALTICSFTFAGEAWTVTTSDFASRQLKLTELTPQQAIGLAGQEKLTIPLQTLVTLTQDVTPQPTKGLVLCLAGGDRLIGRPKEISGTALVWTVDGVGDLTIPLENATGILRDRTASDKLAADRDADEVRLTNGDTVRGIMTAVTDKTLTLTPATGEPNQIPLEAIGQILFATPPGGRGELTKPAFMLRFVNGGTLSCSSVTFDGQEFTANPTRGEPVKIPQGRIASLEQTGGPVVWLSSRQPTEVKYTPFFQGDFQPRMDRTVTGDPIRFGGRTYLRGIGVHSRTRMTWAVEPGDKAFRTRYAIDGNLGYADVDVRVLVDDKPVHQQQNFKAGVLAPVVEADLANAHTLTLEVDYGAAYDVQDRFNWIEPAIIRDTK